eukprot:scaffold130196_cov36-Phaeocystis_antarctica.AAC.1
MGAPAILTLLPLLTLERLVVWQELARVYHPKGAGRYSVGCQDKQKRSSAVAADAVIAVAHGRWQLRRRSNRLAIHSLPSP